MVEDTSVTGGQQTPLVTTPPAVSAPPAPSAPSQQAPSKPAYSFDSIEAATAFAEAQLLKKRQANDEAARANSELAALKSQVELLVAQNKAAQAKAITADVQLQAKTLGFRNPALAYAAISGLLQYGADGVPTNAQSLLEALKQSDSYLLETPGAPAVPQSAPTQQPATQPQTSAPQTQQPRTGVMNAPRSAQNTPLTLEEVQRISASPRELKARQKEIDAWLADPTNYNRLKR